MAVEIEKKYRLTDRQREMVLDNLREIGAEFIGEDFEENNIYGGGILSEQTAVLRIRKTQDRTILTYKRRIENDLAIKQQTEYETAVENASELEMIVESLGLKKVLIYEKRRKTYRFRAVEIVLDELPFGDFMEIEGSITAIAEAEMFLDADNFTVEHETYPRLTMKLGKKIDGLIIAAFQS